MLFVILFFFDNFALYQNKRVAIIELRNEDEENVIIYSQLTKLQISLVKKFKQLKITYFPHYT